MRTFLSVVCLLISSVVHAGSFKEAGILPGVVSAAKVQVLLEKGGQVFIDQGTYIFPSGVVIPSGVNLKLVGETKLGAKLVANFKGDLITNHGFVELSTFTMETADNTGNAAFVSTASNNGMTFKDLYIRGFKFGIVLDKAVGYEISGCRIARCDTGILLENRFIPDAGNGRIISCAFGGQPNARAAIVQRDGGGLIVQSCSFLGFKTGVLLNIKGNTSVLRIQGCGFETQSEYNVFLQRRLDIPGSGFTCVDISDNELTGAGIAGVRISDMMGIKCQNNIMNLNPNKTGFEFVNCTKVVCDGNLLYVSQGGRGTGVINTNSGVSGVNFEVWDKP